MIQAMILAAGEGTRLRPLTLDRPKPLLPVAGMPLICYALGLLQSHGVREVAINLHYKGEMISGYLGDGSCLGMSITYSREESMLGTAGAVRRLAHLFADTFVVLYGDVLTDCDLSAMIRFHRRKQALATLALFQTANPSQAGIVGLGRDSAISRFVEKPSAGSELGRLANGGVYVLERALLDTLPEQGCRDFGFDVFPRLLAEGRPLYGYPLPPRTCLIDIGTPEGYRRADEVVTASQAVWPCCRPSRV
ncbi:MAG: nucleotidyltransferase family protein [Chloroflexota bacterium]